MSEYGWSYSTPELQESFSSYYHGGREGRRDGGREGGGREGEERERRGREGVRYTLLFTPKIPGPSLII